MSKNIFHMDCNEGADYVVIEEVDDKKLHIEIGHCCVVILDAIVPLEWFTGIFSGIISETCKKVEDKPVFALYDRYADWLEVDKLKIREKLL